MGLALATLVWFARARHEIAKATRLLARAAGETEHAKRRAFAERYGEISDGLDALPKIGPCWRKFRETLERPDTDAPGGEAEPFVRNERRPQDYFTLANAHMSGAVLRSAPGMLVGLGLVLTFAGLIAALAVAAGSLGAATGQDAMRVVLEDLLGTAGAKFHASATALGCSILLGLMQRVLLARLARRMHGLNDALEVQLRFDATASTARRQLDLLREQLMAFNQDFALKVGDAVRDAVNDSSDEMSAALKGVTAKLDALVNQTSADIPDAVEKRLDGVLSDTLATMEATLREVGGSLGRLPGGLGDAVTALWQASEEMVAACAAAPPRPRARPRRGWRASSRGSWRPCAR